MLRRGQGLSPFPRTPFSITGPLPSVRSGQVLLDEDEHLFHNRSASVAALRKPFAFPPESVFAFAGILIEARGALWAGSVDVNS